MAAAAAPVFRRHFLSFADGWHFFAIFYRILHILKLIYVIFTDFFECK